MSTPTVVQGNTIPLQFSTDDLTYKNVVCSQAHEVTGDSSVTQEDTDCGTHTAYALPKWSATFQGVLNTTPNGASEVSAEQVLTWFNNQTDLYLKTALGSKTFKVFGKISNYAWQKATAGLIKFTMTFTANGSPTIS